MLFKGASAIIPRLQILYTNIGRGHPFYLDGIIDALVRKGSIRLVRRQSDVFDVSNALPRLLWKTARWLYTHGSSGGLPGILYRLVRSRADYNGSGLMARMMGRDIRRMFLHTDGPLIVAHPTLVGMLRDRPDILYQHGEMVVPREALVGGASIVFVPTDSAAEAFRQSGYSADQVVVSGLCIEPSLVKQAFESFDSRLDRYAGNGPLTGAFFSSGAEPGAHIEKLTAAAHSVLRKGDRALIFARHGGRLVRQARRLFLKHGVAHLEVGSADPIPVDPPPALIVEFTNRREENIFGARLFPLFDYLVAPPHERSNWACGLGLPMFTLEPSIGPFAPMNRDLLREQGVAEVLDTLDDARSLGTRVERLRNDGTLETMCRAGWGKQPISGFETIADYLLQHYD